MDVVKLRLRGRGSGFKEGQHKRESPEPLHLCVSSLYFDKFQIACEEVERMLKKLYSDYYNFTMKRSRRKRKGISLRIKKVQNQPVQVLSSCLQDEKSYMPDVANPASPCEREAPCRYLLANNQ